MIRAPRFPLKLAVRYRQVGRGAWHVGTTENISRSGVLVRADHPVEVHMPLELRLQMLGPSHDTDGGEIWFRGRVVRTIAAEWHEESAQEYAVAIDQYDLVPRLAELR